MITEMEKRIRKSFDRQAIMKTIGAAMAEVKSGQTTIVLPFRGDLTQQHGFFHAGIAAMIADNACGYAALTLMPAGAAVLTVEFKVNFISPAQGEALIARGRVLKPGRTLSVCSGEVYARDGGTEKLVATMLATMIAKKDSGMVD